MAKKNTPRKKASSKSKSPERPARQLKKPEYRSFRYSKRIKHPKGKLPNSFKLFATSIRHILSYKKLYFGIAFVYLVLTVFLVKGFGFTADIPELKETFQEFFTGTQGALTIGVALFGQLIGSAGSTSNDVASVYQSILLMVVSLALIWALRQTHAKAKVGAKDAFYRGMYPFIPFMLVLLVIGLQLIPLLIGNWLFGVVVSNGIAVAGLEKIIWGIGFFMLALLSFYMVSSSVFALYIVTLPDMRPLQALRSARELVRYRRWMVVRKVFFLPVAMLLIAALIIIPLILFLPAAAEWVFFGLSMLALAVVHSYMYNLYRELL